MKGPESGPIESFVAVESPPDPANDARWPSLGGAAGSSGRIDSATKPRAPERQRHDGPCVSVLMPARDAALTLPACLRSLRRQSYTNWECLVVDDHSGDATPTIVDEVAVLDDRIRLVPSPQQRGLVVALNAGLSACRGRYVARMDADDLMIRDRLALQVAALEANPGLAAIGAHVRTFPRRGLTARRREYEAWLNGLVTPDDVRRDAFVECPIAHPTLMAHRDTLTGFGYRDVGWPEDYDLILRMLEAGHQVGVVPRRLLAWRDTPGRESRTHARYSGAAFTACKAWFLASGLLRHHREYILWGYGDTGRLLRRALLRLDRHPTHIVEVKRGRLGQRIHGAAVIGPDALRAVQGTPIVVSVARAGPRALIRAALASMGFVELRDYVCAA
jgi:glycosyltransferase involved in cell wall biosynthesis